MKINVRRKYFYSKKKNKIKSNLNLKKKKPQNFGWITTEVYAEKLFFPVFSASSQSYIDRDASERARENFFTE